MAEEWDGKTERRKDADQRKRFESAEELVGRVLDKREAAAKKKREAEDKEKSKSLLDWK